MSSQLLNSFANQEAGGEVVSRETIARFRRSLENLGASYGTPEWNDEIERLRRVFVREVSGEETLKKVAVINVVADLIRQGWNYTSEDVEPNEVEVGNRQRRRSQLLAQRTEQLRNPSVQAFIRRMEKSQWFRGKRVSIFSLMRDGREMATALEKLRDGSLKLSDAVSPYLQFVGTDDLCEHTGIPVSEIWRYFRYTWTNPFQSIPGRAMTFLVRDAATPYHAVMGIGCLGSSAVKLRGRDEFIGWEPETVLANLDCYPPSGVKAWLGSLIDTRLSEIYKVDFVQEKLFSLRMIEEPSVELIASLREESAKWRDQHHRLGDSSDSKNGSSRDYLREEYCIERAVTSLFKSKRAAELADLLWARIVTRKFFETGSAREGVRALSADRDGKKVLAGLLRLAKSIRVGTSIADLTVCGAVPPYNPLLVGKLTAMLAVSPEAVLANRSRYGATPSIIASSIAGRPIFRPADLVFVGTTSLYGELPCQYSGISVPAEVIGGKGGAKLKYRFLNNTAGWGTFQFSQETTRSIGAFLRAEKNGQRVNYLFGEGANPKMRALREGLSALGFNEELLLNHGQSKAMFGVGLVSNLREYLLGQDHKPKYLFSLRAPARSSQKLIEWWAARWLFKRLDKPGVLDEIRRHTLVHPIEHGARVRLPAENVEQSSFLI